MCSWNWTMIETILNTLKSWSSLAWLSLMTMIYVRGYWLRRDSLVSRPNGVRVVAGVTSKVGHFVPK